MPVVTRTGNTVEVNSIFEFEGCEELFVFMHKCKNNKLEVHFLNEDLWVPAEGADALKNMQLSMYMAVKTCPEIVESYNRYLAARGEAE